MLSVVFDEDRKMSLAEAHSLNWYDGRVTQCSLLGRIPSVKGGLFPVECSPDTLEQLGLGDSL